VIESVGKRGATAAEIAVVEKAQRLWDLLKAAMPDWGGEIPLFIVAHRSWPGGRTLELTSSSSGGGDHRTLSDAAQYGPVSRSQLRSQLSGATDVSD
jgi:hypothetical protein